MRNPVILLDGVPLLGSANTIMDYDPLKVQKLEIVKPKFFFRTAAFDGILSFSTYNGNLEGFTLDPRTTVVDYEGLQIKREFYAPVYETAVQYSSRIPDFRNLLYWAPEIRTDKSEKEISFYTSDLPGTYAVVVQGVSKEGHAGYQLITIQVK